MRGAGLPIPIDVTDIATRIPSAEYAATIKPRLSQAGSQSCPGVVLVLRQGAQPSRTFCFASWNYLRERLRVFGFATAKELDSADVRLHTGKQPYKFSSRRWESPLIDALDLTENFNENLNEDLH
jgi:hypothetical protein